MNPYMRLNGNSCWEFKERKLAMMLRAVKNSGKDALLWLIERVIL
jgi:hypothetical protein